MQAAEVPLPPPDVDPGTASETVADVLSRPEYAGLEPGVLDRVQAALAEALGRLLSAFTGTPAGSLVGWLLLAALAAAVAWLVLRWARTVRRGAVAPAVVGAEDVGRSPEAWLADAEAHEAAGRWRDGVRCRYRALVASLAAAGRLEEVAGRTAGEYRTALRAAVPEADAPFSEATALFERAWYGAGDVHEADARAVAGAARATLEATGRRPVGAAA